MTVVVLILMVAVVAFCPLPVMPRVVVIGAFGVQGLGVLCWAVACRSVGPGHAVHVQRRHRPRGHGQRRHRAARRAQPLAWATRSALQCVKHLLAMLLLCSVFHGFAGAAWCSWCSLAALIARFKALGFQCDAHSHLEVERVGLTKQRILQVAHHLLCGDRGGLDVGYFTFCVVTGAALMLVTSPLEKQANVLGVESSPGSGKGFPSVINTATLPAGLGIMTS